MSGFIRSNKPLQLLFLNYEFPPLGGGAATAAYYLLKEFAREKSKLHVDLVTSSIHHRHIIQFSKNIQITRLDVGKRGSGHLYQKLMSIAYYLYSSTLEAFKMSFHKRYDMTLVFFALPSGVTAFLLKIFFRIPYIISLRGSDVPGFNERFYFLYPFIKPFFWLIARYADAVVANSDHLKRLVLKILPGKKILIIPNGVDSNVFKPIKNKKNKLFTFLCVARLIKRKDVATLVRATSMIKHKKQFKVLIVGNGNQRYALTSLSHSLGVKKFITFAGDKKREQMPSIYQQANAFILPSKNEGMSNAILEAAASGLSVISTPTGDVAELFKKNYLSFPVGDSLKLSRIMEKLISNRALNSKLGKKSREIMLNHDWSKLAEKYRQIIVSKTHT